jgi:hypothetical protein
VRAGWWPAATSKIRAAATTAVVRARAWRLHAALPGLTGAVLISTAAGMRFGAWAGLLAAGIFALRLDARL